mgnify:CR=1 FL=1
MADNKVHFGLKNAYYFPMTETTNPVTGEVSVVYGAPVKWAGAVSIGLSNNASQEDFYADDGVFYVTSSASSYEGDFESASVPRQFKKDIYDGLRTLTVHLSRQRVLRQNTSLLLLRHLET